MIPYRYIIFDINKSKDLTQNNVLKFNQFSD